VPLYPRSGFNMAALWMRSITEHNHCLQECQWVVGRSCLQRVYISSTTKPSVKRNQVSVLLSTDILKQLLVFHPTALSVFTFFFGYFQLFRHEQHWRDMCIWCINIGMVLVLHCITILSNISSALVTQCSVRLITLEKAKSATSIQGFSHIMLPLLNTAKHFACNN
jgi:hypothetical protein